MFGCKFWLQIISILEVPDQPDSESEVIVWSKPLESEVNVPLTAKKKHAKKLATLPYKASGLEVLASF
jgi:hypothetical protein